METPRLSRDAVLDTALRIVEERGLAALTMRGLAADLGVAATAIYWHVGNRDALVAALTDRVLGDLGDLTPPGSADGPQERIVGVGRVLRRRILARPHAIALLHEQGRTAVMMRPAQRALAAEVAAAGLGGERAATVVRAVLHHVVGFVLLERAVQRGPEPHPGPDEVWRDPDGVDPALAHELGRPHDPDALFEVSLSALVSGLLAADT
ncbi:TetR/AcrR family transcriptional regulator [Actinomadura gamaensis]|uniref:TetR/AcrR family transcriptional regulator n=1 Tax=Actinomadura gamaensis TaxID=1763541 RepID=A0ABV9U664_9ACTN